MPGIPAAIGCLAYAGVPVTYLVAGEAALVRGHESEVDTPPDVDWSRLAGLGGTLVCFAGSRQIGAVAQALLSTAARLKKARRSSTTARCRRGKRSRGRSATSASKDAVRKRLEGIGAVANLSSPMEFRKVIQSDIKAFQEVARTAGLEPK